MSKKKLLVVILALGTILAFGVFANGQPGYPADVEKCGHFGLVGTGDAASWLTDKAAARTAGENLTAMGIYSPFLDKATGGAGSTYVQFTPDAGTKVSDLAGAGPTTDWGFWYFLSATPGPHLELRFENKAVGESGHVDITIMAAQHPHATLGAWTEVDIDQTTITVVYYGTDPDGHDFSDDVASTTLGDALIALEAECETWSAVNWELTRVRLELWEAGARTCYVDDIEIKDKVYDLEPCGINLYPDISKNVKTAEETFTVVDGDGFEIDGATVCNWIVAKGNGEGDIIVTAGGGTDCGNNFITVFLVTTGDCIITCDVISGEYEVTLDSEKKWGEIYRTELTAWSDEPCQQRPTGSGDNELTRAGIIIDQEVLVQEKVIAKFLPGMVEAAAGGAEITWWLLKNDSEDEAQLALEALIQKFDRWDFESGDLGWGEGCGQYKEWATPPDLDFIPKDMIEVIYAANPASDTKFVEEECGAVTPTTTTVTYTDHIWEPLGEGFTNTTVKFSQVGITGEVEPVIVVVLADYPIDLHGQNAVCVEYFKFTPKPLIEYKDVQTLVVDVITDGEIDPIRKMLYVFVRDYDGTPANPEAVEFQIDHYGLFDELLADTNLFPDLCDYPECYPGNPGDTPGPYPSGIFEGGKSATSVTRLGYADEKVTDHFDGVVTSTGDGTPLDMDYSPNFSSGSPCASSSDDGYAIAGVRIVSSFKKCVDILIKVHDCHGCEEVIIIRDVMVCFGAPDSAVNTYDDGAGWYGMSVPLTPANTAATAVYDELGAGVEVYGAWPFGSYQTNPPIDPSKGTWVYLHGTTSITVEGSDAGTTDTLIFTGPGWYLISAPFTADWKDATFSAKTDFYNDGGNVALWVCAQPTGGYPVKYSNASFVLNPWTAYWVKVLPTATLPATITFTKTSAPVTPLSVGLAPMGLHATPTVSPPPPPTLESGGISVALSKNADGIRFVAAGPALSLRAKVLSVDGALIAEKTVAGDELVWAMKTSAGELVANGVYLIQISAETYTGWVDLGLFRVLVLR